MRSNIFCCQPDPGYSCILEPTWFLSSFQRKTFIKLLRSKIATVDSCLQTLMIIITRWWEISHKSAQSCTGLFQMKLCTFLITTGAWISWVKCMVKHDGLAPFHFWISTHTHTLFLCCLFTWLLTELWTWHCCTVSSSCETRGIRSGMWMFLVYDFDST